jgi:hypothetical protein
VLGRHASRMRIPLLCAGHSDGPHPDQREIRMHRTSKLRSGSTTSEAPPSSKRTRRAIATAALLLGASVAATVLCATAASAGPATIGTFKLTGQIAGTVTLPASAEGSLGVPLQGCQVALHNKQVLINMFTLHLPLNGKIVKESNVEVSVSVAKDGSTASLKYSSENLNGIAVLLTVNGSTYSWSSISGTVELKAKGDGGSFTAHLVPTGSALLHNASPITSGKATAPVTISGSFSSCHAFA